MLLHVSVTAIQLGEFHKPSLTWGGAEGCLLTSLLARQRVGLLLGP
jgi:hypothetical protein